MAATSVDPFEAMEIFLRIRKVGCSLTMIFNFTSVLFSITVILRPRLTISADALWPVAGVLAVSLGFTPILPLTSYPIQKYKNVESNLCHYPKKSNKSVIS